jgi:hypothetical protein
MPGFGFDRPKRYEKVVEALRVGAFGKTYKGCCSVISAGERLVAQPRPKTKGEQTKWRTPRGFSRVETTLEQHEEGQLALVGRFVVAIGRPATYFEAFGPR